MSDYFKNVLTLEKTIRDGRRKEIHLDESHSYNSPLMLTATDGCDIAIMHLTPEDMRELASAFAPYI